MYPYKYIYIGKNFKINVKQSKTERKKKIRKKRNPRKTRKTIKGKFLCVT